MSRRNGRRLDRRNHNTRAVGVAAQFAALFAGQADAVYLESDNYNSGAGTWADKLDPTHILTTSGGVIAAPAVTPRFTGPCITFAAAQTCLSNRNSARFVRMNDGLGCTVLTVHSISAAATNLALWSTYVGAGAAFACAYAGRTTNQVTFQVGNVGALAGDTGAVGATAINTRATLECYSASASTPNMELVKDGTQVGAVNPYTLPVTATPPAQALRIGGLSAALSLFAGELRAFYFLPYVLSASQRVTARAYMAGL